MQILRKSKEKGLSLKKVSIAMLIVSVGIALMLLVAAIKTFNSFQLMKQMTNNYIALQETTAELMAASDYLTEEVQCYTVIGDRKHLDNYFEEAEVARRRESAIRKMEEKLPDTAALNKLKDAMSESLSLMNREYYAMRLILEAKEEKEYPAVLGTVKLSDADRSLGAGPRGSAGPPLSCPRSTVSAR